MSARERIIGIDLGTTNSAAAIMEGGRPTIIPSAEGPTAAGKMFPSVVAFTQDDQLLVGDPAKRQWETNPDVTIMEFGQGVFEVKATSGDTQTGGADVDYAIVDLVAQDFKSKTGIDLRNDRTAMARLKEACENAKIQLSNLVSTEIDLPFIA